MKIDELIEKTKTELEALQEVKVASKGNEFYAYAILEGKIEAKESILKTLQDAQRELERKARQ